MAVFAFCSWTDHRQRVADCWQHSNTHIASTCRRDRQSDYVSDAPVIVVHFDEKSAFRRLTTAIHQIERQRVSRQLDVTGTYAAKPKASRTCILRVADQQSGAVQVLLISDIMGKTGLAIIEAIMSGERDADVLANLRDQRIKASEEIIAAPLQRSVVCFWIR